MPASPDIGTYLFTQGILGVACLALGYVCVKLYNKIQTLQSTMVQDAKDTTKEVVNALNGNTQSNMVLAEKIEASKREQL